MIGKVIKYNCFREKGIIYSFTNQRKYPFEKSNAYEGDVDYGYIVNFYAGYDEESGRRYARDISVVECMDDDSKKKNKKKNRKKK